MTKPKDAPPLDQPGPFSNLPPPPLTRAERKAAFDRAIEACKDPVFPKVTGPCPIWWR